MLQRGKRRPERLPGGSHRILFLVMTLAVTAADQAGKAWAAATRTGAAGETAGGLVRNSGASFGLGSQWTVLISLVTLGAVLTLAAAGLRTRSHGWTVALALMAGGAAGNGADRLLRAPGALHGAVVDWISVPGYGPLFNLADVALRTGTVLAFVMVLRGRQGRTPGVDRHSELA